MSYKGKYICVINGRGGVGKDTLVNAISNLYNVMNVSSITPIKVIADNNGWWKGGKSDAERKLLAGLKQVLDEYNGTTIKYLIEQTNKFLASDIAEVMFVHIREPENIAKYIEAVDAEVITILIESERAKASYGNQADDNVENFAYDYYYQNDKGIDECGADFTDWFYDTVIEPREHSHYYAQCKVLDKRPNTDFAGKNDKYCCTFAFEVGRTCDDEKIVASVFVSSTQDPICYQNRAYIDSPDLLRSVVLPTKVLNQILEESERLRQQLLLKGVI